MLTPLFVFLLLNLIPFMLFPCASVGGNLLHEFHISYTHTEWDLFFSDIETTTAQCTFGVKKYKYLCTGKPIPLN